MAKGQPRFYFDAYNVAWVSCLVECMPPDKDGELWLCYDFRLTDIDCFKEYFDSEKLVISSDRFQLGINGVFYHIKGSLKVFRKDFQQLKLPSE